MWHLLTYLLVISLTWHTTIASTLSRRPAPLSRGGARVRRALGACRKAFLRALRRRPPGRGGVRLVGRARARLEEVVSVELVVLHSVGLLHVACMRVPGPTGMQSGPRRWIYVCSYVYVLYVYVCPWGGGGYA